MVLFGRPQWQATRCFAMRLPWYRFKREVPEDIGKVKLHEGLLETAIPRWLMM